MATNTQPQYAPEPFTRPSLSRIEPPSRWQVSLGMGQLIVFWSTIAGIMVAVFLFGIYSGREQGFKQALDEHNQLSVRLPVGNTGTMPSGIVPPGADLTESVDAAVLANSPSGVAAGAPAPLDKAALPAPDLASIDTQIAKANEMVARLKQEQSAPTQPADAEAGLGFKGMNALSVPEVADAPAKPGINRISDGTKLAALDSRSKMDKAAENEKLTLGSLVEKSAQLSSEKPEAVSTEAKVESPAVVTSKIESESKPTASAVVSTAPEEKVAPTAASGWGIQIAAEKSQSSAQQIVKRLKAKGFSAQIERAVVNKTSYYRVLVGPYASKSQATQVQKKLVKSKLTRGASFIRRVG